MVKRLTELSRPFIVCNVTDRTPQAAVATMRLALLDGAGAFELNLPALAHATPEDLRAVFSAVDRPTYTSCRRAEFMTVYGIPPAELPAWTDDDRMRRQLEALRLGSVALDMELDTFDPHPAPPLGTDEAARFARAGSGPAEVTHQSTAIARQREVIEATHEAGGDVILSCHTGRPLPAADLVALGELAEGRGADLLKIVTPCLTLDDLLAVFAASAKLRARLSIPFTLIGAGEVGLLSRSLGVAFGSAWAIGQQTLTPNGFHAQPLVAQLREIFRLIPWRYDPERPCV